MVLPKIEKPAAVVKDFTSSFRLNIIRANRHEDENKLEDLNP